MRPGLFLLSLAYCGWLAGCAGSTVVRQTALKLRAQVVDDEKEVDKKLASQREFYQKQTDTIAESQRQNVRLGIDEFRRSRSASEATTMSRDPNAEARMGSLMEYLLDTHDQEYQLWQKLFGSDQRTREELKTKLAKLERQKNLLQQVKDNLTELSISPSRKQRAKALLDFSQQTYDLYKKTESK